MSAADFLGQPFGHGGFPDPRITHEHRVVLASPAEHLHGPVDLEFTPDERVQLSHGRPLHQIHREGRQRVIFLLLRFPGLGETTRALFERDLGHLVGDIAEHVQAGDPLVGEEILGRGIFLLKNGRQDVPDGHFLFFGRTRVVDGPLDDPLKPDGLLQHVFAALGNAFDPVAEKRLELLFQVLDVSPAVLNDFGAHFIVQNGKQYVLDAHVFMPPLLGFPNGEPEGGAEFLADHDGSSSMVHLSGKPFSLAMV